MRPFTSRVLVALLALTLLFGLAGPAAAAPEGTMTWGVHITLACRWLDQGIAGVRSHIPTCPCSPLPVGGRNP